MRITDYVCPALIEIDLEVEGLPWLDEFTFVSGLASLGRGTARHEARAPVSFGSENVRCLGSSPKTAQPPTTEEREVCREHGISEMLFYGWR
ncbi:MAG: hypothetical protein MSC30_20165, partial [Gaiellaceae bacterium MAG52_C11]|nr:hypothetical protein [Candidatus Gaiellasilicea maunaloa]